MLVLKYLTIGLALAWFAAAAGMLVIDLLELRRHRNRPGGLPETEMPRRPIRWKSAGRMMLLSLLPMLLGMSISVVPAGMAGVRVSQMTGTRPGALQPGVHFAIPFIHQIELYSTRDHLFSTAAAEDPKRKTEMLKVHTKEGLGVALAISVRFRLDSRRLDVIHATLPQPVEEEIVPAVVASVLRQVSPNYMVRELFSTKRDEAMRRAAEAITQRLGADGIVVKEVMLRDIVLPPEYARGLEGLLLKQQENERLSIEVEVKEKQVRTAELEAEADKAREVKRAEGQAHGHVKVEDRQARRFWTQAGNGEKGVAWESQRQAGVEKQAGEGGRRQTDLVRAKPAEKQAMELR
jgi:regulator of protease activity HflC (stomatin/prohibitin superfamily)